DRQAVERLLGAGVTRGDLKQLAFDLVESGKGKHRRVFAVGLGPAERVTTEGIRRVAGQLARALRKHKLSNVVVALPQIEAVSPINTAEAIVTGILLASFRFEQYKGAGQKDEDKPKSRIDLTIVPVNSQARDVRQA